MTRDPIVEEVRKVREGRAARYSFDPRAIAEEARRREKESERRVVCPPKRRPVK